MILTIYYLTDIIPKFFPGETMKVTWCVLAGVFFVACLVTSLVMAYKLGTAVQSGAESRKIMEYAVVGGFDAFGLCVLFVLTLSFAVKKN